MGIPQEAKYVESWPNTPSAWAGWRRFDIPVDRYDGVHSLLICTSSTLGSPSCHWVASREIPSEQNLKKRTGPALCVLCGHPLYRPYTAIHITQEAKFVESWPNTTSAWAGWSIFDIPVESYGGVHSQQICTSITLGFSTCQ
jgi:hypothetical protein